MAMMSDASSTPYNIPVPQPASFPTHNSPRIWFITSALSPLAVRLIRLLLAHGDYVAAGLPPAEIEDEDRSVEFKELIIECKSKRKDRDGWKERIRGIRCDGRSMSSAQSALAEAIEVFGRIDILLCNTSEAVVGGVEELSTSVATRDLVRRQFEVNFFGPVNFIKSILPIFRSKHNGHIVVLTSVTGHIGTPGMPMYASSMWALEGYCDSLAYEIAPFNIKLTIVQPSKEITLLTNKIIFAPQLPDYQSDSNPAPGLRDILMDVINVNPDTRMVNTATTATEIVSRFPKLTAEASGRLVMETVMALTAIGGHENPPARHIVGHEGVTSVKEKLKTVSEELEDFVEASLSADISSAEDSGSLAGLFSGPPPHFSSVNPR